VIPSPLDTDPRKTTLVPFTIVAPATTGLFDCSWNLRGGSFTGPANAQVTVRSGPEPGVYGDLRSRFSTIARDLADAEDALRNID
jgi:hypothetical protein